MPLLIDVYAKAHAREFASAELEQMIAFAASPAGRHYLRQTIALDQDPAVIATQQLIMSELMPVIEQIGREQCARRAAQRVAAGDAKAVCPLAQQSAAG